MTIKSEVFHLNLTKAMLEGAVLAYLPGDPGRSQKIASFLDNPKPLSSNREYNSWLGYINGQAVVVCSTGIGGPSLSICVEELAQLGIKNFIRIGTSGAIQDNIKVGDLIVSTGAVRLDGASRHFAPIEYPAAPSFDIVEALVNSAKESEVTFHTGVTASSDTFYPGQERYDTYTKYVPQHLQGAMDNWKALNVLNFEMEGATLFTQVSTMKLKAGMIAGIIVNRNEQEIPDEANLKQIEEKTIKIALLAGKKLLNK